MDEKDKESYTGHQIVNVGQAVKKKYRRGPVFTMSQQRRRFKKHKSYNFVIQVRSPIRWYPHKTEGGPEL